MPFTFQPLAIPDVILITPQVFTDPRGLFLETYQQSAFADHGITTSFVQDNLSRSVQNTLRGLHYQVPPQAQAKLVWVNRGEIFDVAVDLRRDAPTYGQHVAHRLDGTRRQMLFVPTGFAHGFCVLSDEAEVQYKVSAEYSRAHEHGIRWDDPQLGIPWPVRQPILSEKDQQLPKLNDHLPIQ